MHWFDNYCELVTFCRVLSEADAFRDQAALLYFLEKPWKWETEYEAWVRLGRPAEVRDVDDLRPRGVVDEVAE